VLDRAFARRGADTEFGQCSLDCGEIGVSPPSVETHADSVPVPRQLGEIAQAEGIRKREQHRHFRDTAPAALNGSDPFLGSAYQFTEDLLAHPNSRAMAFDPLSNGCVVFHSSTPSRRVEIVISSVLV
jgi:hypothetical protein